MVLYLNSVSDQLLTAKISQLAGCVENANCGLRGRSHIRKLNGTIVCYNFVTHYFELLSSTTLEVKVRVNAKVRAKAKGKFKVKDKVKVKVKSL